MNNQTDPRDYILKTRPCKGNPSANKAFIVERDGQELTILELAKKYDISHTTANRRLRALFVFDDLIKRGRQIKITHCFDHLGDCLTGSINWAQFKPGNARAASGKKVVASVDYIVTTEKVNKSSGGPCLQLAYAGEKMSLIDWSKRYRVNPQTARFRIKKGLAFAEVFEVGVKKPDPEAPVKYQYVTVGNSLFRMRPTTLLVAKAKVFPAYMGNLV